MTDTTNPEYSEGDRLFVGKVIPLHVVEGGETKRKHVPVLYLEITSVTDTGYRVKHISPTGKTIRTLSLSHDDVESAQWATYTDKPVSELMDGWADGKAAV